MSAKRPAKSGNVQPLPAMIATMVMQFVASMHSSLHGLSMEVALDGRDGLWEVACSETSWLTDCAAQHGIAARRINFKNGFDIYQYECWEKMAALRRTRRPKKIWFSVPCTKWCQWTNVNYNTPERREVLETMRRRERRMLRWAKDFVLQALTEDDNLCIYWEWTHPCSGWEQRPMLELEKGLWQQQHDWLECRVDGCCYGMKDKDNNLFLRKRWLIKTNDPVFAKNFRMKICPRNHEHSNIQGLETARSAYYPKRMVEAIIRHWRREMTPLSHLQLLAGRPQSQVSMDEDENWERRLRPVPSAVVISDVSAGSLGNAEEAPRESCGTLERPLECQPARIEDEISAEERQAWSARIAHYHKAAGHPSNQNLVHLFRAAGLADWKVAMMREYRCEACERLKPGGTSSGQIPPAATHQGFRAWQALGMDTAEWLPPERRVKVRFLLMIDLATRLRVIHIIGQHGFLEMRPESTQDIIKGLSEKWLCDKPRPSIIIPDNAKSFTSREFTEFCQGINVQLALPAEKEPWAHGLVESAIRDIKTTASAILLGQPDLSPAVALMLSCAALNSTEYVKGYSSFQWCYGKDYLITDEDERTFQLLPEAETEMSYEALVRARQEAEQVARQTRALRVMTRLRNSSVRQPLRTFHPMDLVKVWRKEWPATLYQGKRGGGKKSMKPHWIGPDRVIFHEVLPHQSEDDDRRHVVWVLIGSQLLRCSVHSVRPVTETERIMFEISSSEDPTAWRSLADVLPQRQFTDMSDQVPGEDETEELDLPDVPDASTTLVPHRRVPFKQKLRDDQLLPQELRRRLNEARDAYTDDVNDYEPSLAEQDASPRVPLGRTDDGRENPNDLESQQKRIRHLAESSFMLHTEDVDTLWAVERQLDDREFEILQSAIHDDGDLLRMEWDVDLSTNRQRKMLEKNPAAFMVKKMRDSEVIYGKLPAEQKLLFDRAKGKEVSSFISNEAVRKCLDDAEVAEALGSGRILRARWVLTWKLIPPEDLASATKDAQTNPKTVHTSDGRKKAKARIVLLGFEHPDAGSPDFKTSSPVQSGLARNLLYQMTCQHGWKLEGLDLATAFLQTEPTEADARLWTSGVVELREALGVGAEGIMKIMRNIYGSTTAPRGLWLDLHKRLAMLGGRPVMDERCLWIWYSQHLKDEAGHPRTIGLMGGHVDDFHRSGDDSLEEWREVCRRIYAAYTWGMAKTGEYRHAGTDLRISRDSDGDIEITVNQQYYIDMLTDVEIPADRLRQDHEVMTPSEISACRTALGALQWLAVQTQPLLSARCNLLLTELTRGGKMSTAFEIQQLVCEVRRMPSVLKFFRLKGAKKWTDLVFITMADQAHANRPDGNSTGGMVSLLAGPEAMTGKVCPMVLLGWRTWRLRRKAISSNDAEVQAVLEAEDHNFRVRLLWSELHGGGYFRTPQDDQVVWSENQVRAVRGVLCTDSKGGYDAVQVNESPLLGLSNLRSALQAMQLRESMMRTGCLLRWLASDYDLGDSMTKKRGDCRLGLAKFLSCYRWCISFDPSFTSSKKNHQKGKSAVKEVDASLHFLWLMDGAAGEQ